MGLTLHGGEKKPIELVTGTVITKIASGADHLVMLAEDGQMHTVGCGEQGQLGRVSERGADRMSRQGMGVYHFFPDLRYTSDSVTSYSFFYYYYFIF